jgi:3-phosphoshikimate 1-carboxyvinyltransferase
MSVTVYPATVSGRARIPASKSHTMRALLLASMARGCSRIAGALESPDVEAMVEACRALGARLEQREGTWWVEGVAGHPTPAGTIDCGNSGQVLRFAAAMGALGSSPFCLTGDQSIRTRRPVSELINGLSQLGASVTAEHSLPPLRVCGPLVAGRVQMRGEDSQPVSALLMALSMLPGPSQIEVEALGERPWIGLTCWWLRRLGVEVQWRTLLRNHKPLDLFRLQGGWTPQAWEGTLPADWSSAAFPVAAALLAGGEMVLEGLDPDDPQGDRLVLDYLRGMGARWAWEGTSLRVWRSQLSGGTLDANAIIDAVPILCALAPFTEQGICLENVGIARRKESDRLEAMAQGIRRLGGRVETGADWIRVRPGPLGPAEVDAMADHRVAMAFSIAALRASGPIQVLQAESVAKSYPRFFEDLSSWGARVERMACSLCS